MARSSLPQRSRVSLLEIVERCSCCDRETRHLLCLSARHVRSLFSVSTEDKQLLRNTNTANLLDMARLAEADSVQTFPTWTSATVPVVVEMLRGGCRRIPSFATRRLFPSVFVVPREALPRAGLGALAGALRSLSRLVPPPRSYFRRSSAPPFPARQKQQVRQRWQESQKGNSRFLHASWFLHNRCMARLLDLNSIEQHGKLLPRTLLRWVHACATYPGLHFAAIATYRAH